MFEKCFTFPYEVEWFIKEMYGRFKIANNEVLHLCCGESQLGNIRVDLKFQVKPDLVADVLTLPNILGFESRKYIVIDPPWVIDYNARRLFSYAVRDLLKIDGIVIWNSPWFPWCKGFSKDLEIWAVLQNFNSYRDIPYFYVMKKILEA